MLVAEKIRDGKLMIYPQKPLSIWNVGHIRKLAGLGERNSRLD